MVSYSSFRTTVILLFMLTALSGFGVATSNEAIDPKTSREPLTEAEAKTMIERQFSDKALEQASRKAELSAMPTTARRVVKKRTIRSLLLA